MLELTSNADMMRLETNPSNINPATNSIDVRLLVSYSLNTNFPMVVHLLAQTNNLNNNS